MQICRTGVPIRHSLVSASTGMPSKVGAVVSGSGRRCCQHAWNGLREKGPAPLAQGLQLLLAKSVGAAALLEA